LVAGLGIVAVALAFVVVAPSDGRSAAARLRLDGVRFQPELALTPAARSRGLMFRERAPRDGMLFVYGAPTRTGFWMRNTRVPLAIVFFDRKGRRLLRLSMTPCRRDPCRIYRPRRSYTFALELPARDPRPAVLLGPVAELDRLVRAAE
jgi:uncharacterized membrane protein (UPF0127 family)